MKDSKPALNVMTDQLKKAESAMSRIQRAKLAEPTPHNVFQKWMGL